MNTDAIANILVVDDEPTILKNLSLNLELENYQVTKATNGLEAVKACHDEYFDMIILDVMMPEMDGLTVAETLRASNNKVPILFLSAKNTTEDKIAGLKKGGDDYITKPFELEELLLRVKVLSEKGKLIRAKHKDVPDSYSFKGNIIDFNKQQATNFDGAIIDLSKKEIMLLKVLIENANEVVSREHILQVVWGYNVFPNTRTIDNFILNFRKYFEKDSRNPIHFHSVRGVGYKFTP